MRETPLAGPGHRAMVWAIVILGAALVSPAEGGEDDVSTLVNVVLNSPSSDATVSRLKSSRVLPLVMRGAASQAEGAQVVNVLDHIRSTGWLDSEVGRTISSWIDSRVVLSGTILDVTRGGPDEFVVAMAVREVFRGELRLTSENSPLKVRVRVLPWRLDSLGKGRVGENLTLILFTAGGAFHSVYYWETSGRERSVFGSFAVMGATDPHEILEGVRSENRTESWLATVRAAATFREVSPYFDRLWGRKILSREKVEPARDQVEEELLQKVDLVRWNAAKGMFEAKD